MKQDRALNAKKKLVGMCKFCTGRIDRARDSIVGYLSYGTLASFQHVFLQCSNYLYLKSGFRDWPGVLQCTLSVSKSAQLTVVAIAVFSFFYKSMMFHRQDDHFHYQMSYNIKVNIIANLVRAFFSARSSS